MVQILLTQLLLSLNLLTSFKGKEIFVVKKTNQTYLDLSDYDNLSLKPQVNENKEELVQTKKTYVYRPVIRKGPEAPADLKALFNKYGNEYGIGEQVLEKIGRCESGFNPQAVNGPYAGMYQFVASTWVSNRKAMGLDPNPNLRFNTEEAIRTTAFKISRDGTGAWPVCGR